MKKALAIICPVAVIGVIIAIVKKKKNKDDLAKIWDTQEFKQLSPLE